MSDSGIVNAKRICAQFRVRSELEMARRVSRFARREGRAVDETGSIRILIADDHTIVREGLSALINRRQDMQVVAEASNGMEAVDQFIRYQPDVALIDLRMPRMGGVEAMKAIRDRYPSARLVVLTTFDGDEDISRALHAGAKGYLLKDASLNELLECIRTVQSGEPYIPPEIAAKLASWVSNCSWDPRELQVLNLMVNGKDDKEIAVILHLSRQSVEAQVAEILEKLGVSAPSTAIAVALKRGIVSSQ